MGLALQTTNCIIFPTLVLGRLQCMIVSTIFKVNSVKFDAALLSQGSNENYHLAIRNTETQENKIEMFDYGQ